MFKIWMPDVDSPSYFVALAAVELGCFKEQGIDIEFIYKVKEGAQYLRDGKLHFIAGPAYASTDTFPGWKGARLLCALAQNSYWFLAVRKELDVKRGDLEILKGMRISAAPSWPGMGLRFMLADAGIDLERDNVRIVGTPPAYGDKGFMARQGINALQEGMADAYWGNGMRVAIGEHLGIAKMHLDLRRGDGPPHARFYNFPALTTTERLIAEHPEVAAGAVRAIVKTQKLLKADPAIATGVAAKIFPADETPLIAELIRRDAPYYDAEITQQAVDGLMRFAQGSGLVKEPVPYDRLVATQFRELWKN